MTEHEKDVFIGVDGTEHVVTGYRKPDLMVFKDASGEEHRIFMDLGTQERACQLYMDENWEELKKFPKHVGQTHAEMGLGKAESGGASGQKTDERAGDRQ